MSKVRCTLSKVPVTITDDAGSDLFSCDTTVSALVERRTAPCNAPGEYRLVHRCHRSYYRGFPRERWEFRSRCIVGVWNARLKGELHEISIRTVRPNGDYRRYARMLDIPERGWDEEGK